MEFQKQFVAENAHRIADRCALRSLASQIYSARHAKRVRAEVATADNARCIAIAYNVWTWANGRGLAIDADSLFVDADDLAAAAGLVNIPEFYAAPKGASRRQMCRLWANFAALKIAPVDGFELVRELDGREWLQTAQSWAETSRGFVGKCVGWSDRQLAAKGIARPMNPLDGEASAKHPRDEYAVAVLDKAADPWATELANMVPCLQCGRLDIGILCEKCADDAAWYEERRIEDFWDAA